MAGAPGSYYARKGSQDPDRDGEVVLSGLRVRIDPGRAQKHLEAVENVEGRCGWPKPSWKTRAW